MTRCSFAVHWQDGDNKKDFASGSEDGTAVTQMTKMLGADSFKTTRTVRKINVAQFTQE